MCEKRSIHIVRERSTHPLSKLQPQPGFCRPSCVTFDAYKLKPRTESSKPEQVNGERYICLIFMDPMLSSPSSALPSPLMHSIMWGATGFWFPTVWTGCEPQIWSYDGLFVMVPAEFWKLFLYVRPAGYL